MTKDLTHKQIEALQALERFISENGMSPTFSELHTILGVSSNQAVINYLDVLEEQGYIERKKTARGIRVIKSTNDEELTGIFKLLAEIKAGKKDQKNRNVIYTTPVNIAEDSGKVLGVSYNNEQY